MLSKNLKLIEYHPNHFRISGTANYFSSVYKTIEVNGEKYTNEKIEEITIDFDELFALNKGYLDEYDYFDNILGALYFWHPYENNPLKRMTEYSGNPYINALFHILNYISENKSIKLDVYCGKKEVYDTFCERTIIDSIKNNQFCIELMRYGFNSCLYIYMTYQDMLKYNMYHYCYAKGDRGYYRSKYNFLFEPITDESQKTDRLLKFIEIQTQNIVYSNQTK
jgi:hypothetical protein